MANKQPTTLFQLRGTIKAVYPIQVIGKFRKCPVLVTDPYGNDICLEATFERADQMGTMPAGTPVDVTFGLTSNPSKQDPTRYFTSATIVNIVAAAGTAPAAPPAAAPAPVAQAAPVAQPAPAAPAEPPAGGSNIPF